MKWVLLLYKNEPLPPPQKKKKGRGKICMAIGLLLHIHPKGKKKAATKAFVLVLKCTLAQFLKAELQRILKILIKVNRKLHCNKNHKFFIIKMAALNTAPK